MESTPVNIRVSADEPRSAVAHGLHSNADFTQFLLREKEKSEQTIKELEESLVATTKNSEELEASYDSLEIKNKNLRLFLKTQYELNQSNSALHPKVNTVLSEVRTTVLITFIATTILALMVFYSSLSIEDAYVTITAACLCTTIILQRCYTVYFSSTAISTDITVADATHKDNDHMNDMVHDLIDSQY